ncbi:MAG TPA: NAD(+)/NADH kinase [Acidobacteriaceae bacterium]|jgi:NAD+ kinase
MRTIAVISKPQKPDLAPILQELLLWMRMRGIEPILDPVSGSYVENARIVPRHEMASENPELAIVLGGDGTLLAAARVFAKSKVPILSVNLGSLGFLTEVRLSELFSNLEGWSCGKCHIDARAMLHVDVIREGQLFRCYEALNDIVVSKGAIARMGDFRVLLGEQLAMAFRADGVIVSTPTGSTAYNLAANGPIMAPDVEAMIVTPICPHLLTIRPMVVHGDAKIHVSVVGVPEQTYLTVDGQEAIEVQVGDNLLCRRSEHTVQLMRLRTDGFFDVLRQKLKWGER